MRRILTIGSFLAVVLTVVGLGTVHSSAQAEKKTGTLRPALRGDIAINNVSLAFGEKEALKNVSFSVKGGVPS